MIHGPGKTSPTKRVPAWCRDRLAVELAAQRANTITSFQPFLQVCVLWVTLARQLLQIINHTLHKTQNKKTCAVGMDNLPSTTSVIYGDILKLPYNLGGLAIDTTT